MQNAYIISIAYEIIEGQALEKYYFFNFDWSGQDL